MTFASHQLGKCLTAAQNVRLSAAGLPDILSDTPEIIFAITVVVRQLSKFCRL